MDTILRQYDPTIEESYQTTINIDNKPIQVEILDTAGQDECKEFLSVFQYLLLYLLCNNIQIHH